MDCKYKDLDDDQVAYQIINDLQKACNIKPAELAAIFERFNLQQLVVDELVEIPAQVINELASLIKIIEPRNISNILPRSNFLAELFLLQHMFSHYFDNSIKLLMPKKIRVLIEDYKQRLGVSCFEFLQNTRYQTELVANELEEIDVTDDLNVVSPIKSDSTADD